MKETLEFLAKAYSYPSPGAVKALWALLEAVPTGLLRRSLENFLRQLSEYTLAEREELYTRTLDLTPLTAPYVGYAVYGEDYRRGRFMATLNAEYRALGLDTQGEIPDHLSPVLRYLAVAPNPLPELMQMLDPALKQIRHTLYTLEPQNPYLQLIEATQKALSDSKPSQNWTQVLRNAWLGGGQP